MKIKLGENTLDKRGISETQKEKTKKKKIMWGAVEHDIKN